MELLQKSLVVFLALTVAAPLFAGTMVASSDRQAYPNILIILVDDLGWHDVGYLNPAVGTPHIDALAESGVRLDQFYANPTCSPSRASLLTGLFSRSHGVHAPVTHTSEKGLPIELPLLPQLLSEVGYSTHLVGKWHLGSSDPRFLPTARGFDSFYGHLNGGIGYFDHIFSGGLDWQRNGVTIREDGHASSLLAAEARRIVESQPTEQPFFMLLAFNAPHTPLEEPDGSGREHSGRETLVRMVGHLDSEIGSVLNVIDHKGLREDTLIMFVSDNGGSAPKPWLLEFLIPPLRDGYSDNGPLRQGKGSVFEGGIRVPSVVSWPGTVAGASINRSPLHLADVMPTLLDILNIETGAFDGESFRQVLSGETKSRERPIHVAIAGSKAMIDWPWKVVQEASPPIVPTFLQRDSWYLFNLENDEGELNDLGQEAPEILRRMRARLESQPSRNEVVFDMNQPWDTFGGEETREPWAEVTANPAEK
tara:strand:- start:5706 stop:7142 length:1437 start_codon:yes stop_codon:yes gene_type:complete